MSVFGLSVKVSTGQNTDVELESSTNKTAVVSISPGERSMSAIEVTSPIMDGSVIVSSVAEAQTSTLVIRCYGTVYEIMSSLDELELLFNQLSYNVVIAMSGGEGTTQDIWWNCGPANTARGQQGEYETEALAGGWQDLIVTIPRQPTMYAQ